MNNSMEFSSKTWSVVSQKSKNNKSGNTSSSENSKKNPFKTTLNSSEMISETIQYAQKNSDSRSNSKIENQQVSAKTFNNNEIKYSRLEKQNEVIKNKNYLPEEKNISGQLQKNKSTISKKKFLDKRKKCDYPVKSKYSFDIEKAVSNVPKDVQNKHCKIGSNKGLNKKITFENQDHEKNNVNCNPTNTNISLSDVSTDSTNPVGETCSNIEKEEVCKKRLQNSLKDKPNIDLLDHKSLELTKTREEIIQQRRIKVAARKKEKKAATKRHKEEEYLQKSAASKYQGVKIINKQEKNKENLEITQENVSIPELADFPCLGSIGKKKPLKNYVSEIPQEVVRKGKPKKTDPISINIIDAINSKKNEQKPIVPVVKAKHNNPVISGNILDSDNPQRKRGKVRLGKKPKLSSLKAHILKERQEKLNMKNSSFTKLNETKKLNLTHKEAFDYQFLFNITNFKQPEDLEAGEENIKDDPGTTSLAEVDTIIQTIHTRRFREYCDNCLNPPLIESICNLLSSIVKFQDRQYARDPIKAHAKRRYVTGLREAEKYLKLGKVKLLIIAPDLEKIPGENGLDAIILRLKEEAQRKFIPYVFGPDRKKLGYYTFKKQKISAVAILKNEGAEEQFGQVISLLSEARDKYKRLIGGFEIQAENEIKKDNIETNVSQHKEIQSEIISSFLEKLKLKDEKEDNCESSQNNAGLLFYEALEKH